MKKTIRKIDLDTERRRQFYNRLLNFMSKERYTIAKESVHHFLLSHHFNKKYETSFCDSLMRFVEPHYREYARKKCIQYLHKTYGGRIYF